MSTGSAVSDQRHIIQCPNYNDALVGDYYGKTWSGADRDPVTKLLVDHEYTMNLGVSNNCLAKNWSGAQVGVLEYFGIPSALPLVWDSNDDLRLITKAADKVRGSSFNLGNLIGESHQTVNLIATNATRIAFMLESIRHGNVTVAKKALLGQYDGIRTSLPGDSSSVMKSFLKNHVLSPKRAVNQMKIADVSNAVLEFQYGWRPLLSDVYDSTNTLAKHMALPFRNTYKVRRAHRVNDVVDWNGLKWQRSSKISVQIKVVIASTPSLSSLLHLNDPVSVAWEVTPFSFVADWFLPIGEWLSAANFIDRFDIGSILRSEKTETVVLFSSASPPLIVEGTPFVQGKSLIRRFQNLGNYADIPLPRIKSLKQALSPEHALNAIALLTSTTDGFRKQLKF